MTAYEAPMADPAPCIPDVPCRQCVSCKRLATEAAITTRRPGIDATVLTWPDGSCPMRSINQAD